MERQENIRSVGTPEIEVTVDTKPLTEGSSASPRRRNLLVCLLLAVLAVFVGSGIAVAVLWANKSKSSSSSSYHAFPSPLSSAFDGPAVVSADGRQVSQNVSILDENGTLVRLEYAATLFPNVVDRLLALDHDARVVGASCSNGHLQLTFNSPSAADEVASKIRASAEGMLVSGSHRWGCSRAALGLGNRSSAAATIMHRIVQVTSASGATVEISLAPANVTSFFQHLHLRFASAKNATRPNVTFTQIAPSPPPATGRRLGIWDDLESYATSFASAVVSDVTSAVSTVSTAVSTVVGAIEGELQLGSSTPQTLRSWQWSGGTYDDFDCSNSHASLDLGVVFELDVTDYSLHTATLAQTGTTQVNLACTVSATSSQSYDHTWSVLSGTDLGEVSFDVGGIPFHINGALDLGVRARGELTESASVTGSVTASLDAQLGVQHTSSSGWGFLHHDDWQHSYQAPTASASASLTAAVSVIPTVSLTVDWMGGAYATVVPFLALSGQISGSASTSGSTSASCSASLGWGVNVAIGAQLNLEDPLTDEPLSSDGCTSCTLTTSPHSVYSSGTLPLVTETGC